MPTKHAGFRVMAFRNLLKKKMGPSCKFDEIFVEKYHSQPNQAWNLLENSQTVRKVEPLDPSTPKPPNHTRFVCISDTHSLTNFDYPIPEGDVLLHSGDFTMVGRMQEIREFNTFMTSLSHPYKVLIAGNHDILMDAENYESLYPYWRGSLKEKADPREAKKILDSTKITYLEDSEVTINGLCIYGSPWVPEFGSWAFMLPRGQRIKKKWDQIPSDIDILITHGPPLGYGDLCYNQARAGCLHLLHTVQQRVKPKYHIFGHIHEGYGILTDDMTTFINASTTTIHYKLKNKPIVFDLPNK